ncbi:short-subunit dehydrogenase [Granulicella aggregans]|uniref:Short-subunit dehydrogenase n=1 Tax=Granulicella aggregans TaxID=474949 RepID=A0A7W7ZIG1_9BACT|nr:SDR family oxidoreductase [Granulicella aggregans]MBB5060549.1 short-subunit dehydrogenase [Granulicella aggregans]
MNNRYSILNIAVSVIATTFVVKRLLQKPKVVAGQVVIITGASSGLGLALAHRFGKAGLKLVLAARNSDDLDLARKELLDAGSVGNEDDILLVACDVSDKHQVSDLVAATLDSFGALDVLINNAGVIEVGPAEDQTVEIYERAMAIDFFGALYATYAALPCMLGRRTGAIVNISSIGGKIAVPHLLPYVSAKFALTGFSQGLHAELRHKGIRVTTVCPGLMRTGGEAHTHFVGQVSKEKLWFQTAARTPLISANVHYAASRVFNAVNAGRAEITITPQAWLAARFAGCAPEATQAISALISTYALPGSAPREEMSNFS